MSVPRRSRETVKAVSRHRIAGSFAALSLAAGVLTACGSSDGVPTLTWYINPDSGGQAAVAAACTKSSNGEYKITTQTLPQDANQQRVQLARRLAAHDSGIDLMSIDPPYTAELSNAGFLAPIPAAEQQTLKDQSFKGATAAATWNGQLVAYPFWSNTQVLWYRKGFVAKNGPDMSQPVTWDQIITTASDNGGTVAVQANKYEGYVVWINALISGAGGSIVVDADKGADAKVTVDSQAGDDAAERDQRAGPLQGGASRPDHRAGGSGRQHVRVVHRRLHGQLDLHLAQLRLDRSRRRQGHRLRDVPGDGRGQAGPPAVRRHRDRGQRLLQPHEAGLRRQPPASSSRRTRAPTPSSPGTCRPARPATRTRR